MYFDTKKLVRFTPADLTAAGMPLNDAYLAKRGIVRLIDTAKPTAGAYQVVIELDPVGGEAGWLRQYAVSDLFPAPVYDNISGAMLSVAEQKDRHDAQQLTKRRAGAVMSRAQFLMAAVSLGLLDGETAVSAAAGTWPEAFTSALDGMDAESIIQARILWASVATIERKHPLLDRIIAAGIVDDKTVDALFGI